MYVICTYDVEEKRCSKLMKILRKYLFHVQRSVFEGELTPKQYKDLQNELLEIVTKSDSVMFFYTYNNKHLRKEFLGKEIKKSNII